MDVRDVPVGIDYALRYGMPAPNQPSNKYLVMQFYGHTEYEEGEEEEEDVDVGEEGEYSANDYDFNDAFLPEQPSVRGVKFCNLSQSSSTQSRSMRATGTAADCGKDPIIADDCKASNFD